MAATELAGLVGAGLAGAAYLPQIWHLVAAQCSAGVSRLAFGLWFASSLLVTSHAVAIGVGVFIVLGTVQLVATMIIVACATKYRRSYCAGHLRCAPVGASEDDPSVMAS